MTLQEWFDKRKEAQIERRAKEIKGLEGDSPELWTKCVHCGTQMLKTELEDNMAVCPHCEYHYRINAKTRISQLFDENSFQEMFKNTYYWYEIASETLPRFKLLVEQTFLKYKDYYEKALEIYNSDVDWKAGWLTAIKESTLSKDIRDENSTSNGTQNVDNSQTNIDLPNYLSNKSISK